MKDDTIFFFSVECWPALINSDTVFMQLAIYNLKTETHPSSYKCVLLKCSPQKSDNLIREEFCIQNQELILKIE